MNVTSVEVDKLTSLLLSLAALPICCDPPSSAPSASYRMTPYRHATSIQANCVTMATKDETTATTITPSPSPLCFCLFTLSCFSLTLPPHPPSLVATIGGAAFLTVNGCIRSEIHTDTPPDTKGKHFRRCP